MKMSDIEKDALLEAGVSPELDPFIKMGQKIRAALQPESGVKFADDEMWNKASILGTNLSLLGSLHGLKSPAAAVKDAGLTIDQAKEIFKMVMNVDPKLGVKDVRYSPGKADADDEDDDL
jgi:hypothetical protein